MVLQPDRSRVLQILYITTGSELNMYTAKIFQDIVFINMINIPFQLGLVIIAVEHRHFTSSFFEIINYTNLLTPKIILNKQFEA